MMNCESQSEAGVYIFGERLKLATWILNHPFQIAGSCTLICCLVAIGDDETPIRVINILAIFFFGLAFLIRFLCRNLCYLVEIDTKSGKIKLFRCFDKGIIEAPLRLVEFRVENHFACFYAGEKFTIFNEYMYQIAEILPKDMGIMFSNNIYARFLERQFRKYRR